MQIKLGRVTLALAAFIFSAATISIASSKSLTNSTTTDKSSRISRPGQYSGYSDALYDGHEMTSQYIAMRDGTRIAIDIFRPTLNGKVVNAKLPVLWMNTPYNRRNYNNGLTVENYPGKALQLSKFGYIVVVADFRGLFASFGKNSGYNRGEWQDAARMDAYDITEWLAKQPWSDGKIGMWGCSATGGSQMQALTTAPPSLRAIFPMSCEWDVYPFASAGGLAPPAGVPTQIMRGVSREVRDRFAVGVDDDKDGALKAAAIAEHKDNIETSGYTPFRDSVAENFAEQWWLKSSPHTYASTIHRSHIAVYAAANWDENSTKYGAPFIFNNVEGPHKLIFGPATHCDWTTVLKQTGFDIVIEEHRFFDYWLKGIKNGVMHEDPVTYYTYNETAENSWRTAKSWPLANEKRTAYFLSSNSLSTAQPSSAQSETRTSVDYAVNDKNFWDKGLTFVTAPLRKDVRVTGHPTLKLWLATSGNDADVIARVDDLAPDGSHAYYNVEGKLRASLRKVEKAPYNNLGLPWHPFTKNSVMPLSNDVPVEMNFDLYAISYVFKAGHRIRLTLNFADERATEKLSPPPQIRVIHDRQQPSTLTLPIIEN